MSASLASFFLVLMLGSGIAALVVSDLLAAVILLAAFSFFSAMFFASLGALDVAFTEAAVGAAITTVLLVTVVFRTERRLPRPALPTWPRSAAVTLAFLLAAAALARATAGLPAMGDPDAPAARHVSPRYIEAGPAETGAPNMVTAVLADYRGYDTLGETVVIYTGGLAVLLLVSARRRSGLR